MPRKICLHVDKQEILKNDYIWTKNNEKNIVFMYERAPVFPLRVFSGSLLLIVFGILFCGSSFSVLCAQCCRLITLRFSLTFIYKSKLSSFAPIFGWWRQLTVWNLWYISWKDLFVHYICRFFVAIKLYINFLNNK